ncbi:hypothetical protein ACFL6P_00075 [Candidatus Latescibacterota bacterium]
MTTKMIISCFCLLFFCCDNSKVEDLQKELSSIKKAYTESERDKEIYIKEVTEITSAINEIQYRLHDIRKSRNTLELQSGKNETETPDVFDEISKIEKTLTNDKTLINELLTRIDESNIQVTNLKNIIENLTLQIEENEQEIRLLKSELAKKENEILKKHNTLVQTEKQLDETFQSLNNAENQMVVQKEQINRGYYIINNENNLLKDNIIQKKGGFLKIGRTFSLNNSINEALFEKIDISKTKKIMLPQKTKKYLLIPERGQDSYRIEKKNNDFYALNIINTEDFWKIRYLVILIYP